MSNRVLITGNSSGIGSFLTTYFLSEGYSVYGISRRHPDFIGNYYHIKLDFENDIEFLEKKLLQALDGNKLDFMIHCAGIEETIPLKMQTVKIIERIVRVNLTSSIELLRCFSSKIISNNGSSVLIFSSVMGVLGQKGKVGYCSTKAGILGIVKAGSLELAQRKIKINAILPGVIETEMTKKLFNSLSDEESKSIIGMHPLGIGKLTDILPIVKSLTIENTWITGQNFIIDGGYSAH